MKALLSSAVLLFLAALALPGCPGELEDPERFTAVCDPPSTIFKKTCATSSCHDDSKPEADLDLESPDVAQRLIDVPAHCAEADPNDPEACVCPDRLLVDSQNPDASYLLEKVTQEVPECDDRMPLLTSNLKSRDVECLRTWILEITGNAPEEM
ncbi:MAG: hypothetical protein KC766_21315 [Myxococcales bacterium]|nr:hypothetical protein [Myxococcales bacterium]